MIAERASFLRATRRVILRIKIKDHMFAFEIRERDLSATVGWRIEVRRRVAFLQFEFMCPGHNSTPRSIGALEYWSHGVVVWWSIGVLEYWSGGVSEYWSLEGSPSPSRAPSL